MVEEEEISGSRNEPWWLFRWGSTMTSRRSYVRVFTYTSTLKSVKCWGWSKNEIELVTISVLLYHVYSGIINYPNCYHVTLGEVPRIERDHLLVVRSWEGCDSNSSTEVLRMGSKIWFWWLELKEYLNSYDVKIPLSNQVFLS